MNKLLASTALSLLMAAPVMAADLPVRQPAPPVYRPAPIVTYFNWTGCYLGLNGGYGWHQKRTVDAVFNEIDGEGGIYTFSNVESLGPSGGFGGGQVGCNYQAGNAVFGVETDFQGSGMSKSFGPALFTTPLAFSFTGSEKVKWFGTVRGRVGFAADRVLLYLTGGLAFAQHDFNFAGIDTEGFSFAFSNTSSKVGWVAGAGIEWAFAGSWTVKGEYQYLAFGSVGPYTVPLLNPGGTWAGWDVTTASYKRDFHTVRVGINYLFNAAPAPVPVYGK